MKQDYSMGFRRKLVEIVLSQLTQQLNVLQNLALDPMRAIVQQIVAGIWRGDGANAFVEEVSAMMIPGVGRTAEIISHLYNDIRDAQSVIDQADEQINEIVESTIGKKIDFF